jgi:hypothetical protein
MSLFIAVIATLVDGVRYVTSELAENGTNPVWWSNRINDRVNGRFQRALHGDRGIDLMAQDWDTLIVVDAARADLFEETVDVSRFDEYRRVKSRGSATSEWSRTNFTAEYGDTVYVSGNPVPSRHITGTFHEYVEVWREGFDDDIGTIRADAVADAARAVYERHPDKRLIVHFMQPHYPFVRDERFQFSYWRNTDGIDYGGDDRARDVWDAIGLGLADRDEVWAAYRDNLEYVMEYVWDLVSALDGRTVVHSDHGNVVGARSWPIPVRTYGHPAGLRLPDLLAVPWAVIEGDRRPIRDDGAGQHGRETEDMTEKLRALGYVAD